MTRTAVKSFEAKMSNSSESYLHGQNAHYLADLYAKYMENRDSIDASWAEVFQNMDEEAKSLLRDLAQNKREQLPNVVPSQGFDQFRAVEDAVRVGLLIRNYQVRGHLLANLDPLAMEKREYHKELDPTTYGFGENDYNRPIYLGGALQRQTATLAEIYDLLQKIYSSTIGVEYMHIQDPEQKNWIREHIENLDERHELSSDEKKNLFYDLIRADQFEKFLHVKYPGAKRFGLDGGESTIPALEQILLRASHHGIKDMVFGMAHRGRLNVLANVIGKPIRAIFSEFVGGSSNPEDVQGSGDVKYHLGCSTDREIGNQVMHLSLTANPSHLEAVDPVVVGKVRAKQRNNGPGGNDRVMGLLIHGDAAFAGQGLVAETLCLSELPGYRVGGTVHLIINNQIGFTTSPMHSRSSPYCSDVAKAIQAPIFHVNGDDPEAVAYVSRLAMDFRQRFKKDVIIDLFCYRRHGHNEMDEPAFTQPLMYQAIAKQISTKDKFRQYLIDTGEMTVAEADGLEKKFSDFLKDEFSASEAYKPQKADWLDGLWTGFDIGEENRNNEDTVVSIELLTSVAQALTKIPEGFMAHKRLERILQEKKEKLESGENLDWATAEALAFGTLLSEGSPVRLSGQDSCRGTFSQRHAVFIDQNTEARYVPLNHVQQGQAYFEVLDSPLSEASVLGFEYGYSLTNPHSLVMWEAQFGDFTNGAQVIIDQFISSGEAKWLRMSGLVMLLPHAYEGQGPEHSSARPERFLQMCAEYNWQVVNCTTPANYFHVLRRQLRRNIRKPLIVFTPKGLLRHKLAVSSLKDMGPGSQFHRVYDDVDPAVRGNKNVQRVILCTGKVYYDLLAERIERKINNVALIRVEQLYPFPDEDLTQVLTNYRHAREVVWCQEEPENMGAWQYIDHRIEKVITNLGMETTRPHYLGRPAAASTATGFAKKHEKVQKELIDRALSMD
jgi:2-oxoglutarate dehydrogenase E1 component